MGGWIYTQSGVNWGLMCIVSMQGPTIVNSTATSLTSLRIRSGQGSREHTGDFFIRWSFYADFKGDIRYLYRVQKCRIRLICLFQAKFWLAHIPSTRRLYVLIVIPKDCLKRLHLIPLDLMIVKASSGSGGSSRCHWLKLRFRDIHRAPFCSIIFQRCRCCGRSTVVTTVVLRCLLSGGSGVSFVCLWSSW